MTRESHPAIGPAQSWVEIKSPSCGGQTDFALRMSVTAKAICDRVPTKALEVCVSEYHIAEIVDNLEVWEIIAPFIDLTEVEQREIKEDCLERGYKLQKHLALIKWRRKSGNRATYKALIEVFVPSP